MRSSHGSFPECHTSADNLAFVTPAALEESYQRILDMAERSQLPYEEIRRTAATLTDHDLLKAV